MTINFKNTFNGWGLISQFFHWFIALLIALAIVLALVAHDMPTSPEKIRLFVLHKSIGMTVLVLVVLRLLWRWLSVQPAPATHISVLNHRLAHLGHYGLYGLMLALPLSGWVLNSAANFPFRWMDLWVVPDLPGIPDSWKHRANLIHYYLYLVLAITVFGHAFMAIVHHHKHRSNVLSRMIPCVHYVPWLLAFCVVLAAISYGFWQSAQSSSVTAKSVVNDAQNTIVVAEENSVPSASVHTQKQWQLVADNSVLGFAGNYDGAAFEGLFREFTATLYFDPDLPQQGFFDVRINTASITTGNADWDSSLPDEEWFFVQTYPQATFGTTRFSASEQAYIADGVLSIKGVKQPVSLVFQWQPRDDGLVNFIGKAVLDRRVFGIGSGMWAEDDTIGFEVVVNITLLLKPVSAQ